MLSEKSRSYKSFLLLCLLLFNFHLFAGDTTKTDVQRYTKTIHFYYQPGMVIPTHAFVKGDNPQNKPYGFFHSFTAQYGIQSDGKKLWQQLYGYPVWGFGAYSACFPGDHELGHPLAVYAYINAPFKRWKKWSINYEVDFGISFNWKRHDLRENGYYYPIGSFATVFFDFGINSVVQLSKRLNLYFGLNFTHFSNGSVKLPNLGVNMLAPRVGVNYLFNDRQAYISRAKPTYEKEWEWLITLSPSLKQVGFTYVDNNSDTVATAFNYGVYTVSTGVNRQVSYKIKIGGGLDLSYNGAYGADTTMKNGKPEKATAIFGDKFLIGVFPSFELVINQISILAQPGFYIYLPETESMDVPTTYQRVGIKYYFPGNIVAGVNVRAYNFSQADFIEFNVGYTLKWKKSYRSR